MATADDDYEARRAKVRERIDSEPPAEDEVHIWTDEDRVYTSGGLVIGWLGDPINPKPAAGLVSWPYTADQLAEIRRRIARPTT